MVPFGEEARLGSTDRWLRVASGREEWAQPRKVLHIVTTRLFQSLFFISEDWLNRASATLAA